MAKEDKKKAVKSRRPTAQKRDDQSKKRRLINKGVMSEMRTGIRTFHEIVEKGDANLVKEKLNEAYSLLDKAAKRGVIKSNAASRTKSRLAARAAAVA